MEINWTEQPLGQVADREIADRLGITHARVQRARRERNIPSPQIGEGEKGIDWTEQPLGQVPDSEIARELRISREMVRDARVCRNIPSFKRTAKKGPPPAPVTYLIPPRKEDGTVPWDDLPLGKVPDVVIAEHLRVSRRKVFEVRRDKGIPRCRRRRSFVPTVEFQTDQVSITTPRPKTAEILPLPKPVTPLPRSRAQKGIDWDSVPLGQVNDYELARRLGVSHVTVCQMRNRRGIPPYKKPPAFDWDKVPLGKMTDRELGRLLGISDTAVMRQRKKRSIPACRRSIDWDSLPLGIKSDSQIAREIGVAFGTVRSARLERGIPPAKDLRRCKWDQEPLLGKVPDKVLAEKHGVSASAVYQARKYRNIPNPTEETPSDKLVHVKRIDVPNGIGWEISFGRRPR